MVFTFFRCRKWLYKSNKFKSTVWYEWKMPDRTEKDTGKDSWWFISSQKNVILRILATMTLGGYIQFRYVWTWMRIAEVIVSYKKMIWLVLMDGRKMNTIFLLWRTSGCECYVQFELGNWRKVNCDWRSKQRRKNILNMHNNVFTIGQIAMVTD